MMSWLIENPRSEQSRCQAKEKASGMLNSNFQTLWRLSAEMGCRGVWQACLPDQSGLLTTSSNSSINFEQTFKIVVADMVVLPAGRVGGVFDRQ